MLNLAMWNTTWKASQPAMLTASSKITLCMLFTMLIKGVLCAIEEVLNQRLTTDGIIWGLRQTISKSFLCRPTVLFGDSELNVPLQAALSHLFRHLFRHLFSAVTIHAVAVGDKLRVAAVHHGRAPLHKNIESCNIRILPRNAG